MRPTLHQQLERAGLPDWQVERWERIIHALDKKEQRFWEEVRNREETGVNMDSFSSEEALWVGDNDIYLYPDTEGTLECPACYKEILGKTITDLPLICPHCEIGIPRQK